jgi:hypothetical protein
MLHKSNRTLKLIASGAYEDHTFTFLQSSFIYSIVRKNENAMMKITEHETVEPGAHFYLFHTAEDIINPDEQTEFKKIRMWLFDQPYIITGKLLTVATTKYFETFGLLEAGMINISWERED